MLFTKAYASVYSSFALAVSLGSLLLSTELAPSLYDAHIEPAIAPPTSPPPPPSPPHHNTSASAPFSPPPANLCYGGECYRVTHLVVVGLCSLGTLCMLVLTRRTRAFYAAPR